MRPSMFAYRRITESTRRIARSWLTACPYAYESEDNDCSLTMGCGREPGWPATLSWDRTLLHKYFWCVALVSRKNHAERKTSSVARLCVTVGCVTPCGRRPATYQVSSHADTVTMAILTFSEDCLHVLSSRRPRR